MSGRGLAVGAAGFGLLGIAFLGLQQPATGAAGLAVALAVGALAWSTIGRGDVAVLAAALAAWLVLEAALALAAGLLVFLALLATRLEDPRLLALGALAVLAPDPTAWLVPLASAGLLWATAGGLARLLAAPVVGAPLLAGADPIGLLVAAGGALLGAELARRVASARANARNARLVADLGIVAAPAPGIGALLAASLLDTSTITVSLELAVLSLVAGLVLGLAHVGAAALLVSQAPATLSLAGIWVPATATLAYGATGSLVEALAPALAALVLACPAAGLGLRVLAGPTSWPAARLVGAGGPAEP